MNKLILTLTLTLTTVLAGAAQELTAQQIVEKANLASYYGGEDGKATVNMTIVDEGGQERKREFVILRLNEERGGDQRFYVYFKAPADVRKMAYLVWKHVGAGKEDDRWLWLPSMNLKRRIAPGDKRTSFVGSDFLYEDVSGRSITADKHELVETTDKHYKLKSTPKKPGNVKFSYFETLIDKETFLPQRADYYDKDGKHYRTVEALETKVIDGIPTVTRSKASDLAQGGHTVNEFTQVEYNIGLKKRIFTERFLRRPPREVR